MPKYRVALMTGCQSYYTLTQDDNIMDFNPEEKPEFIRWLTDWIEYDVKELDK